MPTLSLIEVTPKKPKPTDIVNRHQRDKQRKKTQKNTKKHYTLTLYTDVSLTISTTLGTMVEEVHVTS